jgi:toxin YhaV
MEVNGWRLFVYPLFQSQVEKLTDRVQKFASQDPRGYASHPAAKLLATINHYIREAIPRDPNSPEYRQGNTLGADNRHWFRAKFHGRYRLFYRFSSRERVIIYAWVNDEMSLRKAGAKTDPYQVFRTMLESAQPPNTFVELLKKSTELGARGKK